MSCEYTPCKLLKFQTLLLQLCFYDSVGSILIDLVKKKLISQVYIFWEIRISILKQIKVAKCFSFTRFSLEKWTQDYNTF